VLPVTIEQSNGQNEEDKETFIVATAARLIWTKGYAYALRAIAALRDHLYGKVDIRYIVMGDGAEFEFLEFERRRLGLEMNVEFTGWLNQLEVARRIKEADVYLLLSIEEGFNNSVMLAQSLGIPCIVSDAGGLPENVVDGVTGFVVPRYSVSAASEKLLILCQDGDLRHQLGENARIRMNSEFSLENQVNRYCDLLNSYIGKS